MSALQITLASLLPVLLIATVYCAASETAVFSLSHRERQRLRSLSPGAARAATRLLGDPPAVLVTILTLNSIVNVLYFVLTSVAVRDVHPEWVSVLASGAALLALILFGEILPKLLARRDPAGWARRLIGPLLLAYRALRPVRNLLIHGIVDPLIRLLRPERTRRGITPAELTDLLAVSAREGELETGEQSLLADIVALGAIRTREIMTPRVDVPFLEPTDARPRLAEAVAKSGLTSIPLLSGPEGKGGRVTGMIDARRSLAADPAPALHDPRFLVAPLFVPELGRLDQLLDEFRRARRDAALCADEHGTIVGLVSIGHIIGRLGVPAREEGETERAGIETVGPGAWLVPGSLRLGDLRDFLDETDRTGRGRRITESQRPQGAATRAVTTIAGLILHILGRLPRAGDRVRIRNLTLQVQSMNGRRIERVLLRLEGAPPAGASA